MPNQTQADDFFGEAIYTYTRKDAIEEGIQVLLEGKQAQLAKEAGWKYPVYVTSGVIELIEAAASKPEQTQSSFDGVLWDVLWMARFGQDLSENTRKFQVIIGRKKETLFMQIGPTDIDKPEPAITIMLQEDL
jgi:hypothetical protein